MLAVNFTWSPKYHTVLLFFPIFLWISHGNHYFSTWFYVKSQILNPKKQHLQVFSWWNPKFSIKNTLAFPAPPNSTSTPWDPSVTSVASLHSQSPALKAAEGNLAEMSLTFVEVKPCCGGSLMIWQRHEGWDAGDVRHLKWHEVYLRDKYRLIEYGNGICTEYNGYDVCVWGSVHV